MVLNTRIMNTILCCFYNEQIVKRTQIHVQSIMRIYYRCFSTRRKTCRTSVFIHM